jgi:hypothetical protein
MEQLRKVASETATRAATTDLGSLNEANTKALFIEPMLTALGWNVLDLDAVTREYPVYDGTFLDYALLVAQRPALFCEAKPTRKSLDDPKWVAQAVNYANNEGVVWCVLTDGLRWRIFKANEAAPMEKKMAFEVHINELFDSRTQVRAETLFACLTPAAVADGELSRLGTQVFVDSKVRASLIALLENPPSKLIDLVRTQTGTDHGLKPADVRGALVRVARLALDALHDAAGTTHHSPEPSVSTTPALDSSTTDESPAPSVTPAERLVKLSDLVLAGVVPAGSSLSKTYLTVDLTAFVREDARVEFNGATYSSLSAAGEAARIFVLGNAAGTTSTQTDGWGFWSLVAADGSTSSLKELRRRHAENLTPNL